MELAHYMVVFNLINNDPLFQLSPLVLVAASGDKWDKENPINASECILSLSKGKKIKFEFNYKNTDLSGDHFWRHLRFFKSRLSPPGNI